jgi:hypothetical protein
MSKKKKFDVHDTNSSKKGLSGLFEKILRSFSNITHLLALIPIALSYIFCITVALMPAVSLFMFTQNSVVNESTLVITFAYALAFSLGYISYGLTIIIVVPIVNFIGLKILPLKPFRGGWYSMEAVPWYFHNALTQLVRYTFLDLMTPTPLNLLFFKWMGMKIGKGVQINSTNISDPALITLDDYVTIGGSSTLFAHYAQKGFLVIAPIHIKKNSTIGLKASIMGDVVIGENIVVPPHYCVLPKSRVESKEFFKN